MDEPDAPGEKLSDEDYAKLTPEQKQARRDERKKAKQKTKAIGDKAEKRAQAILEAQGYQVCRAWPRRVPTGTPPRIAWIVAGPQDFFEAFDLIAIKPGERIRFIQVTADSGIGRKKVKMEDVHVPVEHGTKEVWMWMGKPWKGTPREDYYASLYFRVRREEDGFKLDKATNEWSLEARYVAAPEED